MIRDSYRPLSPGRAASETSFWINLAALALSLGAVWLGRRLGFASPDAMFVVMLVSLLVFSVAFETLLHPKTCGLLRFRVERPLSWRRVAFREVALIATFLAIGFVYWLLPMFGDRQMVSHYRPFLMLFVTALMLLSVPYFCLMDRIDPEAMPSMRQDALQQHPSEVEIFAGTVLELGQSRVELFFLFLKGVPQGLHKVYNNHVLINGFL